jgi:TolA-binding protein
MRPHAIALTLGTCAALAAFAADVPDEQLDVVVRRSGAQPPGRIVREDYLCVVINRGAEMKIPAHAVKEVQYAARCSEYDRALELSSSGKLKNAAYLFAVALDKMPDQRWAAEYCNYGIASALFSKKIFFTTEIGRREFSPPSACFRKALEANPRSRLMPELLPKLVRSLIEEQKLEEAAVALKDAQDRLLKYRE